MAAAASVLRGPCARRPVVRERRSRYWPPRPAIVLLPSVHQHRAALGQQRTPWRGQPRVRRMLDDSGDATAPCRVDRAPDGPPPRAQRGPCARRPVVRERRSRYRPPRPAIVLLPSVHQHRAALDHRRTPWPGQPRVRRMLDDNGDATAPCHSRPCHDSGRPSPIPPAAPIPPSPIPTSPCSGLPPALARRPPPAGPGHGGLPLPHQRTCAVRCQWPARARSRRAWRRPGCRP